MSDSFNYLFPEIHSFHRDFSAFSLNPNITSEQDKCPKDKMYNLWNYLKSLNVYLVH